MAETRAEHPDDPRRRARQALEEVLRRLDLHRVTGTSYVRLDTNQGGITRVTISVEEQYRPPPQ